MSYPVARLIGIPWEIGAHSFTSCDCIGLAVMAQNLCFGHSFPFIPFDITRNAEESKRMMVEIPSTYGMYPAVGAPKTGDWGIITFGECDHIVTFFSEVRALHIFEESTSRISNMRSLSKRMTLFRYRGEVG